MSTVKTFLENLKTLINFEDNEQEVEKLATKFYKEVRRIRKIKKEEFEKKPLNAYMLFCIAKRRSVVETGENIDKPPKEITSILGKLWCSERDANTKEFQGFQHAFEIESKKYKETKEAPKEDTKKEKKEKKAKICGAPKKAKAEKKVDVDVDVDDVTCAIDFSEAVTGATKEVATTGKRAKKAGVTQ